MGEETSVVTIGGAAMAVVAVVAVVAVEDVEEEVEEEEVDEEAEEDVDARRGSSAVLVTFPSPAPISKIVFGRQLFS
jgi:hypothetical protein